MNLPNLMYRLASFLLVVVACMVLVDVSLRYFNASHPGLRVLSRISSVWIGLLALPKLTLEGDNIRIDYFYKRFSSSSQRWLDRLDRIVHVGVFTVLLYSGYSATVAFSDQSLGPLAVSAFHIYVPLVLASFVVLATYVFEFVTEHTEFSPHVPGR